MNDSKNQVLKAQLTTKGRKTGKEHSVWLRAVVYDDKIYFSRRNPESDWLKNSIKNPKVVVEFNDSKYEGHASLVEDEQLAKMISKIKYPDPERAKEHRIVLEIKIGQKIKF